MRYIVGRFFNILHPDDYMGTLALIKCFSALVELDASLISTGTGTGTILSFTSLPFSPVRLVCFVGWVYLCLYFVQRVQFSPLVPKDYKSTTYVVALFLGPVLLFVLLIVSIVRKSLEGHRTIFEILKEQLQSVSAGVGSLHFGFRKKITLKLLDSSGRSITEIYGHSKGRREDSHVLELTEQIVADALAERASDILIDPKDSLISIVRFRIDGMLRMVQQLDPTTCQAVINSIKAVSNMDISERRRPQDGAFVAKTSDGTVSFRVASAGAVNGEKLSIRVLNQNAGMFTLESVGMTEKQRAIIENVIAKPSGMVLMSGPTGSGKTTTLYAMLNKIDLLTRNVITVEDPIEYVLPNASQIEVNSKADITFAKSLRSILRQDPDVICVGEIRDEETAAIALRASQTGHLVLGTIHSDSNASALVRLLDLNITPLTLSSGLDMLVSQRLVRLLCKNCKAPAKLSQNQLHELRKKNINYRNIFQAKGCDQCHGTGYRGRIAIFDILNLDNDLKADIANNKLSVNQLKNEGDKRGRSNLKKQGLKAVVSGITSLEELKRVIG
ncbi:MAG: GspE/PulE family protein [Phycisphaerae bacterium]|nr:GspE/PulE family protein [Phycisphaerae bacterium]